MVAFCMPFVPLKFEIVTFSAQNFDVVIMCFVVVTASGLLSMAPSRPVTVAGRLETVVTNTTTPPVSCRRYSGMETGGVSVA